MSNNYVCHEALYLPSGNSNWSSKGREALCYDASKEKEVKAAVTSASVPSGKAYGASSNSWGFDRRVSADVSGVSSRAYRGTIGLLEGLRGDGNARGPSGGVANSHFFSLYVRDLLCLYFYGFDNGSQRKDCGGRAEGR